ncbi:MAG: fucose dissimilation pathway protein FucU [Rhodoferax sp.]|jgi:L-fucose mutarotase|nr:fucose dissimilation pathway protein FucU [Rhodoferax sp.]
MLKTLPPFMSADLLWVLAAMGHGDQLALVDRNYPAHATAMATRSGKLVQLPGTDVTSALQGILQLLPLDTFIASPLAHMDPVDQPGVRLPVHHEALAICEAAEGREVGMEAIGRFAFYAAARNAFALVHTTEDRPYGCFLLTKGVVFAD